MAEEQSWTTLTLLHVRKNNARCENDSCAERTHMLPDGDMWGDGFRWSTAAQFYHVWSGQKSLVYVIPKQWGRAQVSFC